jgi:hypothetical protein
MITAVPDSLRRRRYLHELVCGMCGRKIEDVLSRLPNPPRLTVGNARCSVCNGQSMYSGERTYQEIRRPRFVDDDVLRPRVGRPPKWLIEARRAAAAALAVEASA